MKIILTLLLLIVTLTAKEQVKFYKPSFDCKNIVKNSIEYKICIDKELSKLDLNLANLYNKLQTIIFDKKELNINKISFLIQRDKCKDTECIKNIYQNQFDTIEKSYKLYKINKIYEMIKNVNLDDFINPDNRNNKILTKEFQKLIENKKIKTVPIKNNYLFTLDNHKLNAGLYCANNTTGEVIKITAGFIKTWQVFKEKDSFKIITLSNSGEKGLGYTEISLFKIAERCSIFNKKTIFSYNYDMESGLCGREELKIERSADIKTFNFDFDKKLLKVNIQEQQCSNKKISNKSLIFNILTERFID